MARERERAQLEKLFQEADAESSRQLESETARNTFDTTKWDSIKWDSVIEASASKQPKENPINHYSEKWNSTPEASASEERRDYYTSHYSKKKRIIGLIYLANAQGAADYLRSGELNMGVLVNEQHRRKGYALQAVQIVLEKAFEDTNCNRVQAVVVDGPFKHAALNVFMKS